MNSETLNPKWMREASQNKESLAKACTLYREARATWCGFGFRFSGIVGVDIGMYGSYHVEPRRTTSMVASKPLV